MSEALLSVIKCEIRDCMQKACLLTDSVEDLRTSRCTDDHRIASVQGLIGMYMTLGRAQLPVIYLQRGKSAESV